MNKFIRNNPGVSSYFGGGYSTYGRYQWNIKFYGWQSEHEVEDACAWAFGMGWVGICTLSELVGRKLDVSIQGRSGGWLVVDTELTPAELHKIDKHVKACLKKLPAFLKDERKIRGEK